MTDNGDMLMQRRGFKISLLEMMGVVTGSGIAIGLNLAESDVLLALFAVCVAAAMTVAIGIAFSHFKGHVVLASFIVGFFAAYLLASNRGFEESVYITQRSLNSRWERMAALVQLEVSLGAGIFCAWITRSLRP